MRRRGSACSSMGAGTGWRVLVTMGGFAFTTSGSGSLRGFCTTGEIVSEASGERSERRAKRASNTILLDHHRFPTRAQKPKNPPQPCPPAASLLPEPPPVTTLGDYWSLRSENIQTNQIQIFAKQSIHSQNKIHRQKEQLRGGAVGGEQHC